MNKLYFSEKGWSVRQACASRSVLPRLAILAVLILPANSLALADPTVMVDPSIQYPVFEGWGTSLAWWADVIGGFPEPARREYVDMAFDPVRGLGLNVVRYNIGGGENPEHLSPNKQFLQYRAAVPGYEPSQGQWDWGVDANQRWVLNAAMARGANQIEAFSNSPPWWMTKSGSVTGNHGGADNIKQDSYTDFADYLTQVVGHFRDAWGITFRSLEPLNEPSGRWSFGNGQEGCHVDRPNQNILVKAVGAAIARRGLTTLTTASDESVVNDAVRTFGHYDSVALGCLCKINTHSYGGGGRTQLYDFAKSTGKDLWLSEYGDGDGSGLTMSGRILEDIRCLHPTAWVYWQMVDNVGGWGFLSNPLRDEATTAFTIHKKYYVMGNYSKFIRPGFRMIAVDDPDSLASYDVRTGTLVVVTTNRGDVDARKTYDLGRFTVVGSNAAPYRTSRSESLAPLGAIPIIGKRLVYTSLAKSVTTLVIQGAAFDGSMGFDPASFYKIINRGSGLVLDAASRSDAASVVLSKDMPRDRNRIGRQEWMLLGEGRGIYKIVNRESGLVLEVLSASMQQGTPVDLYHDKYETPGASNQQWRLVPVGGGCYQVLNTSSLLALGSAARMMEGSRMEQWALSHGTNQQWEIVKTEGF